MNIPVYKPFLDGNELIYANEAINSSWISSKGSFINKFEFEFSRFTGIKKCLTVSNGTVALHLALLALGIGKGDEVIVPTLTYIASVNCIKYVGAKPVFVDCSYDNWQLSIDDLHKKITSKTKAIIAVHLYGFPSPIKEIQKISKNKKIFLIEDCAEAIGTKISDKHVGNFSDIATFSFYGNKTITTGEGGMVATNNASLADKIYKLKTQGLSSDREYWFEVIGYNYRMTNICAAIGYAQLENINKILKKKRFIFEYYFEKLSKNNLTFQSEIYEEDQSSYWMVCFLTRKKYDRDNLRQYLAEKHIETRPIFNPIHLMPMYDNPKLRFRNSEEISKRGINLPSFPSLSVNQLDYICEIIIDFYKKLQ